MRKTVCCLLFVACSSVCFGQTTKVDSVSPNEYIVTKYYYAANIKSTTYYFGARREYFAETYTDSFLYYEKGKLMKSLTIPKGYEPRSIEKEYYSSGKIQYTNYSQKDTVGIETQIDTFFYESGKIKGTGVSKRKYKSVQGYLMAYEVSGFGFGYYESGKLFDKGIFKDRLQHDTIYYESGKIKQINDCDENGKRISASYDEEGNVAYKLIEENGKFIYHEEGYTIGDTTFIEKSGLVADGESTTEYYYKGKLVKKVKYKANKKISEELFDNK